MEHHNLIPILALLGGGLVAVALARITRISTIVWYFVMGALIGDYGFGFVSYNSDVQMLAEIGLAFFLYEVGSHLSVKKIAAEWKEFLSVGPFYSLLVTVGVAGTLYAFGIATVPAILLGCTFSLSSTAIVLKMLEEEGQSESPSARTATAVLLFQDIFAVTLLALLPQLQSGGDVRLAIVKVIFLSIVAFVGVIVLGRMALKPFYKWVFRQKGDEVFTAAALFTVLIIASAVAPLGISLPLGAFLAGVALAETNYSYLVRTELLPFRALLLSLFFLSVGMSLNFYYLLSNIHLLMALTLALMGLKLVLGAVSLRALRFSNSNAIRIGGVLSQGSEFSFAVIVSLQAFNFISPEQAVLYAGVVGLSLALAAPAAGLACRVSTYFAHDEVEEESGAVIGRKEVIIVSFDEDGQSLASSLEAEEVPYRGHDGDWTRIAAAHSRGYHVYFSNPDRPRTLTRASMGEVSAVISLLEDAAIIEGLIEGLKRVAPEVPVLIATKSAVLMEQLIERGEQNVYLKQVGYLRSLLRDVLTALGYERSEVADALARQLSREQRAESFSELALGLSPTEVGAAQPLNLQ